MPPANTSMGTSMPTTSNTNWERIFMPSALCAASSCPGGHDQAKPGNGDRVVPISMVTHYLSNRHLTGKIGAFNTRRTIQTVRYAAPSNDPNGCRQRADPERPGLSLKAGGQS